LGVLLELNSESDFVARNDDFRHLAHEIAVHIAAAEPRYLRREDVPKDVLDRERAIFEAQANEQKKPPQVIEKIIEGKLEKFYAEQCLLEQPFIKDATGKTRVKDLVAAATAQTGERVVVKRFARFQVGESA
jgi:elongation factor Ts